MNAGGYTYARLDTGSDLVWVAAPRCDVAVGDRALVPRGMAMRQFHSPTLDRTFPLIYFVPGMRVPGKSATRSQDAGKLPANHPRLPGSEPQATVPEGHPPVGPDAGEAPTLPKGHPTPGGSGGKRSPRKPTVDLSGIKKAKGGYTVEELFAKKSSLSGKKVVVRGKVVRYSSGILGKNWLHLKDGSGKPGTNDVTVTTRDKTKIGDTVLIRGTVGLDRDFGAGYRYGLIVEDAKVTVEKVAGQGAKKAAKPAPKK